MKQRRKNKCQLLDITVIYYCFGIQISEQGPIDRLWYYHRYWFIPYQRLYIDCCLKTNVLSTISRRWKLSIEKKNASMHMNSNFFWGKFYNQIKLNIQHSLCCMFCTSNAILIMFLNWNISSYLFIKLCCNIFVYNY